MRFCKTLAIVAVVALAMVGGKTAKADGVDPRVTIVVPTDPTIEPCTSAAPGVYCFTTNSESQPVPVVGPTLAQLESPGYDLITDFLYEPPDPQNCVDGVCPADDTLSDLWIAITPTITGASYTCNLGVPPGGAEPAFNKCPAAVGISDGGLELLELECDPTISACTGLLPGEAGSAEIAPEPSELAMLAMGIALVGFCGWKRRQAVQLNRANRVLATC